MGFYIALSVSILNVLLGIFVLLKNYKGATHRYFFFLSLVVAFWSITNYFSLSAPNEQLTLFWIRVVMLVTSFLGVSIFFLVKAFPKNELGLSKKVQLLLWLSSTLSAMLATTPMMFSSVSIVDGNISPVPGPGMVYFVLNFFANLIPAFLILIKKFKTATGLEKLQLRYLFFGVIVSFSLLTITNLVFVVLLKISSFVMFGPAFTLFFIGSIGYAIMKHRFLDISFVLARSLAYILLVAIIAIFYSASIFSIQNIFFDQTTSVESLYVSVALTLIIVFSFQSLKRFLERITERIFYRSAYNADLLFSRINKVTTNQLNLNELIRQVVSIVSQEMKIIKIAVVVASGSNKSKFSIFPNKSFLSDLSDEQIAQLKELADPSNKKLSEKIIIFDELSESKTKSFLREIGVAVVLPLVISKKIIGFVLLKSKMSGEAYNSNDIRFLKLMAPQLAISIKNANSFEEIRNFNIKLKKEIERATKNIKKANHKLKEIDQLKDEFVSVASHELRTPLTSIKSYLWMALAGKGGPVSAKQAYYLERSASSAERLIKLVNDMLNVSRIESGRMSMEPAQVSMKGLCLETLYEVKARAEELGIQLKLVTSPKTSKESDFQVVADADKLKEVLINFIGNSLKFTAKSGQITITVIQEKDQVVTQISDTGIGLDPLDIPNLFQKFGFQKGSYRTNREASQGTGLGLYICKSIIDLHKGRIWAKSEGRGKGACFAFALPTFSAEFLRRLKKLHGQNSSKIGIIHSTV